MARSIWKAPFIDSKTLLKKKELNRIISRNSKILPHFIGKTFYVHNGKQHVEIIVTKEMLWHKFGEFAFTRSNFKFKKND